jgi:hypothetical protein
MNNINTGGPAFPTPLHNLQNDGMTLRDYFAAKVMQGSIAKDGMPRGDTKQFLADQAYEMADAMLKARGQ